MLLNEFLKTPRRTGVGATIAHLHRKSSSTISKVAAVHRTAEAIEVDRGYEKDRSYHECVGSPRSFGE